VICCNALLPAGERGPGAGADSDDVSGKDGAMHLIFSHFLTTNVI
jgi:hypothetical protein